MAKIAQLKNSKMSQGKWHSKDLLMSLKLWKPVVHMIVLWISPMHCHLWWIFKMVCCQTNQKNCAINANVMTQIDQWKRKQLAKGGNAHCVTNWIVRSHPKQQQCQGLHLSLWGDSAAFEWWVRASHCKIGGCCAIEDHGQWRWWQPQWNWGHELMDLPHWITLHHSPLLSQRKLAFSEPWQWKSSELASGSSSLCPTKVAHVQPLEILCNLGWRNPSFRKWGTPHDQFSTLKKSPFPVCQISFSIKKAWFKHCVCQITVTQ